jgi:hypothetical protein
VTNPYYENGNQPADATKAVAKRVRNELVNVQAGFANFPIIADMLVGFTYTATTTGTANTYVAAVSAKVVSYLDHLRLSLRVNATNTGAATINVNGLGAKAIKATDGSDLSIGDLVINQDIAIEYNSAAGYFVYNGPIFTTATSTAIAAAAAAAITPLNYSSITVASTTSVSDIWTVAGNQIDFTGTATVIAFPAATQAGAERVLICAGAPSFTAGANLLIDGVASGDTYTCAANDTVLVRAITTTQFKLTISRYSGKSISQGMLLSERTSNTILAAADSGYFVDITANNFTQTFDDVVSLGSDWFAIVRNSGTGDITLDPYGANEIDDLTGYIMFPGECRLIQGNGSKLTSIVLTPFSKTFTSSSSIPAGGLPPGYAGANITGQGAGGGGGGGFRTASSNNYSGGAGGGGGLLSKRFIAKAEFPTTSITVAIGAGGLGGAARTADGAGIDGTDGGTTTIGNLVIGWGSGGGQGGLVATTSVGGGAAGLSTAGASLSNGSGYIVQLLSTQGGGSNSGGTGNSQLQCLDGGNGGAGGGGMNVASVTFYVGGSGIDSGGNIYDGGAIGTDGQSATRRGGSGGGGGASNTADAGDGGDGFLGGGGGGGGSNGGAYDSGKGGDGGDGYAEFIGVL